MPNVLPRVFTQSFDAANFSPAFSSKLAESVSDGMVEFPEYQDLNELAVTEADRQALNFVRENVDRVASFGPNTLNFSETPSAQVPSDSASADSDIIRIPPNPTEVSFPDSQGQPVSRSVSYRLGGSAEATVNWQANGTQQEGSRLTLGGGFSTGREIDSNGTQLIAGVGARYSVATGERDALVNREEGFVGEASLAVRFSDSSLVRGSVDTNGDFRLTADFTSEADRERGLSYGITAETVDGAPRVSVQTRIPFG